MTLICNNLVLMKSIKEIRDFYKCIIFCLLPRNGIKNDMLGNKFGSLWL